MEHIFELELTMRGATALEVRFEGQRRRQYRGSGDHSG